MPPPLLADFALRLAGGLAAVLLLTSWRAVPPAFFRTHCQVILGLLVLGALDLGWSSPDRLALGLAIVSAVAGYAAAVAWGLGLPRLGVPLTATVVAGAATVLTKFSLGPPPAAGLLNAASRLASAGLLGSTLSAMLLGHYYLTAPAMSIDPLRRCVRAMAIALGARGLLAAAGLVLWLNGGVAATAGRGPIGLSTGTALFLAVRWGMGLIGPALATYLALRTVQIRSTQSATGILYIAMILVLFGELTGLSLARHSGLMM